MDPLPIGPHTKLPEPAHARDGVAGRYSKTRTRAASREAQRRGGRTEEVQVERRNQARSERADETRAPHRDRRLRSKSRTQGQRPQADRPEVEQARPQGARRDSVGNEFATRLQSKARSTSKLSSQSGAVKLADQSTQQESPALAAAVTLAKPAASATQPAATQSPGKVTATPARGAAVSLVANAGVQAKEAKQRVGVATQPEAVPTPERDQASEVLRQVRLQLFPEARTATVYLKPAELGRVSIQLMVEGEQVQAIIRAESPEALTALEQHMPELQASLADRGFADADLDLALGFERDDNEQLSSASAVEPSPDQIHRLFANAEGVDFYA